MVVTRVTSPFPRRGRDCRVAECITTIQGEAKVGFGLKFNRLPYAKRSWPNAEHYATRRGQMRSIAPRLVAKCGAAAHGSC